MVQSIYSGVFRDLEGVRLFGENSENQLSLMLFSFRDGNPRISVLDLGKEKSERQKPIQLPFDHLTFSALVELLEKVIESKESCRYTLTTKRTRYKDDAPTDQIEPSGHLFLGKDKEMTIYFAVKGPLDQAPTHVFKLKPSKYLEVKEGTEIMSESHFSHFLAKGLLSLLRGVIPQVLEQVTAESGNVTEIQVGSTRASRAPAGGSRRNTGGDESSNTDDDIPY